jgi:hypothetical protein
MVISERRYCLVENHTQYNPALALAAYDAPYEVFFVASLSPCRTSVGTPMFNEYIPVMPEDM